MTCTKISDQVTGPTAILLTAPAYIQFLGGSTICKKGGGGGGGRFKKEGVLRVLHTMSSA